jgi:hypothetical protein
MKASLRLANDNDFSKVRVHAGAASAAAAESLGTHA